MGRGGEQVRQHAGDRRGDGGGARHGRAETQVRDAADVEGFDGADAVVLGGAVYAGRWLKPARTLVADRARELAARPTWLFSSGPVGDPPLPDEADPEGIAAISDATGARAHEVFAGKLDRGVLSRPERLMVRALRVAEGDFRDWSAIRDWARGIAAELGESRTGAPVRVSPRAPSARD